jgi:CHAT domain-containing protein/Flp pilus assembly protein TadD
MKLRAKLHWSRVVVAVVCLALPSLAQDKPGSVSAAAAQAEEASLRAVVEKFFAAYGKKDLAGMMALWSEKSPDLAVYKKTVEQQFATDDFSFSNPMVSRVKVEGDKASLRVTVDLTAINLQSKQSRQERMVRNFGFVKEGSEWKVWRYVSAANDLAEALVRTKTEAERAVLLAEEKELVTRELLRALSTQAGGFATKGNYPQSLSALHLTQRIAEQIGDKTGIASVLNNIGNLHFRQGNYAEAVDYHQKSLEIKEALGNKVGIATSLGNIGAAYFQQGNYVQALEYYRKSLVISEAIDDKAGVAYMLNNIGLIHSRYGNYVQALEYFPKSLVMKEILGDKPGMSNSLHNIGYIHFHQGDYAKALESFRRSLAISEALDDKVVIAAALNSIGGIHLSQGNYVQALEYYQKSLALQEVIDDKIGMANTLDNLGNLLIRQDNYAQALEFLQKSLTISETIGDEGGIIHTLGDIGFLHFKRGNYTQAGDYYLKSLAIAEVLGDKNEMSLILNGIADVHNKQARYQQALEFAGRAAALARQIGNSENLWQTHLTSGTAHRALDQPAQARQAFEEAITIIETMRHQVAGGEQEAQRFFENKLSPYLALVDLLVEQNNSAGAFTSAEGTKSRVLLDVLYSGRINISKAMTDEEQKQERDLNNKLVSLNAQIFREKQRQERERDKTRLDALESDLQKNRLEYEAFQTNLYAAHPGLKIQRAEAQPLTLEQADALLPDAKTALLEFVVGEDKTFLFVLTRNTADSRSPVALKVFTIAIKQKELAKQTEQFRQQLANPGSPVNKMARELFDLLFKDAHSLIQGKDKLVIAPDGPLWEMPFQALLSPRNRYLIQDHAIAYTPSLTVLREMIELRQRKSSEAPTLLAVANPALGKEVVERHKALMNDPLDSLPDAEKQVQSLGKFYGPRRSRIYVGAAATEGRVKAEAGQHAILHLATHGILNDRSPMYSHLVLAQADEKDKEDGLLEAWEILNLDLKADLAVLSACETARGRVGAGEGMIGLTWALFVAGVPTTVVSQWKVRSDSTAELMIEFHRLLQARDAKGAPRLSRAEALQQAALKLLNSSQYRHPFFWAGFVLVGDGR